MWKNRWLRRATLFLLLLWALHLGVAWLFSTARLRSYLTRRLEAAFGRTVEVGEFRLSLLGRPSLEANYVTIGEDPQFGREYFLRAESLSAMPRLRSLVAGRLEFGTLALRRPSLNLVRNPDGRWNLENWLPPVAPGSGVKGERVERLDRIEVNSGRVNFKRGPDKHPFAFVDVSGRVALESGGQYRLDLSANLMRAGVETQEPGTLRVRGRLGGTAARLRPAEIEISWSDASLADAFRLAHGNDAGVRGRIEAQVAVRSVGAEWQFSATARAWRIHRWDLAPRPDDPELKLTAEATLHPVEARVEVTRALIEAPGSRAEAKGSFSWAGRPTMPGGASSTFHPLTSSPLNLSNPETPYDARVHIVSQAINLGDLLAWLRAFRPGVDDDVRLNGTAAGELDLAGWPPRFAAGKLEAGASRLTIPGFSEPVEVSPFALRIAQGKATLSPIILAPMSQRGTGTRGERSRTTPAGVRGIGTPAGAPSSALGLSANWLTGANGRPGSFEVSAQGKMLRAEDWQAIAAAFGWDFARGWHLEGLANLDLRWQGTLRPFEFHPAGAIEVRGFQMRAPFLNRPVELAQARIDLGASRSDSVAAGARLRRDDSVGSRPSPARPGKEIQVRLQSVSAFGAIWRGTLSRASRSPAWEFAVTTDRLDAADLDRWLNPRWQEGFFERFLPEAVARMLRRREAAAQLSSTGIAAVQARGDLTIGDFMLAPLRLRRFRGRVELGEKTIEAREVAAEFAGGRVRGLLRADFTAGPSYQIEAQLDRVELAQLAALSPRLAGRFAGTASGKLHLETRGAGREELLRELAGRGEGEILNSQIRSDAWLAVGQALVVSAAEPLLPVPPAAPAGAASSARVAGEFKFGSGSVNFDRLLLEGLADSRAGGRSWEANGSVSYSGALDLRVNEQSAPSRGPARTAQKGRAPENKPAAEFRVTGSFDSPEVARLTPPPRR